MRQRRQLFLILTLGATLLLSACGTTGATPQPSQPTGNSGLTQEPAGQPPLEGPPSIRGMITSVQQNGATGSLMVEGQIEADTAFDKAAVRITEQTAIFRKVENTLVPATIGDLRQGQRVEATFTGPVAESYPVQATAGTLVLLP